jgi:hypothetical protein
MTLAGKNTSFNELANAIVSRDNRVIGTSCANLEFSRFKAM